MNIKIKKIFDDYFKNEKENSITPFFYDNKKNGDYYFEFNTDKKMSIFQVRVIKKINDIYFYLPQLMKFFSFMKQAEEYSKSIYRQEKLLKKVKI